MSFSKNIDPGWVDQMTKNRGWRKTQIHAQQKLDKTLN